MSDLNLALIGNCNIGALINAVGEIVWGCFPRFDSDAPFCSLLQSTRQPDEIGIWGIDVLDHARSEQQYVPDTPVLVTRLYDSQGGGVEVTDFAPRFQQHGRIFCPMMLVPRETHRRQSANSPASAPGIQLGSAACHSDVWQQPHPLPHV
jgi:GH15 family glucan-1,4-alpha-glucosidase